MTNRIKAMRHDTIPAIKDPRDESNSRNTGNK
jgi:hypothetical protein